MNKLSKAPRRGQMFVRSSWFFLTLSSPTISKQEFFDRILREYKPQQLVVVVEKSPGGHVHYHALMGTERRMLIRLEDIREKLDLPYLYMRYALGGALAYLLKEDKNPTVHPPEKRQEIENLVRGMQAVDRPLLGVGNQKRPDGVSFQVATAILNGATLQEIQQTFPSFYLMNATRIQQFERDVKVSKDKKKKKDGFLEWKPIKLDNLSLHDAKIAMWLNYVYHVDKRKRNGEQVDYARNCHLFIHGETECGKSRLLGVLRSRFGPVFDFHYNQSNWQDDYEPPYKLIFLEEFKDDEWGRVGGLDCAAWNHFFDGLTKVNQKYKAALSRDSITPCILVSNKDPRLLFQQEDMEVRNAFLRRMTVVDVPKGEKINILSEYWSDNLISFEEYAKAALQGNPDAGVYTQAPENEFPATQPYVSPDLERFPDSQQAQQLPDYDFPGSDLSLHTLSFPDVDAEAETNYPEMSEDDERLRQLLSFLEEIGEEDSSDQ